MELAITQALEDTEKMKNQIQSILTALMQNSQIVEVDLTPIIGDDETTSDQDSNTELENFKSHSSTTENGQFSLASFAVLASETFLIPFMDRWIWGTTILNSSEFAANLPELYLTKEDSGTSSGSSTDGSSRNSTFSYNYSVSLLEVPAKTTDRMRSQTLDNMVVSIPFHDLFRTRRTENPDDQVKVHSGCRAWVTACFGDPFGNMNRVSIRVSIFCDKLHQWSTTFTMKSIQAYTLFNDNVFEKHRPQIFSALTALHKESFKIERRFSQLDKCPSKVFQKFLTCLGFDVIKTVQTGLDTFIDTLTSDKPTLLYGLLVIVERNLRDTDSSQCSVSGRSSEQMNTFAKLFKIWANKQYSDDRKRGLKGFQVSTLNSANDQSIASQLLQEIEFLEHLFQLGARQLLTTDFSKKWLLGYLPFSSQVDAHFMQAT